MVTPHPRVQLPLPAGDVDAVLSCSPGVTAALGTGEIAAVAREAMGAGDSAPEVAAAVVRRSEERWAERFPQTPPDNQTVVATLFV